MKKILFSAYSLNIGGIETALVNLINYLVNQEKYDITLALEKKEGIFLDTISSKVNIIEYIPNENKNKLLRKIINGVNRIKFICKYKNKFDASISYATYSLPGSFMARTASKNCSLWVHNNYLAFFENNEKTYLDFFNNLNVKEFKNIIFVSQESKDNFKERFNFDKEKLIVCNNLIDYRKIIEKSEENIDFDIPTNNNETIFLNVGRHDEKQKNLTLLIESAKRLKNDKCNFKILLVGNGENTEEYKNKVRALSLEDNIIFVGPQKNPYPYYKMANCVILTSNFEGYPVVYVESMVLNKPIITTNVSDSLIDIKDRYGIVCEKNVEEIYCAMKKFIENGYIIKNPFNPEQYNKDIIQKLEKIIDTKL